MLTQNLWRMVRTLIVTYIISGILLTLLAFALYRFRLPESQITLGINGVYVFSCFIGGLLAGKSMKSRRFLWGLATGLLYFFFLFLMSFFQDRSVIQDTIHILTVLIMCSLSGMAGGMLS